MSVGNHWAYNLEGIEDDPLNDPNTWREGNDPAQWAATLDAGTVRTFGNKFCDRFLEDRHLHSTASCWSATYSPSLFESDRRTRAVWGDLADHCLQRYNKNPARPRKQG